MAVSIPPIPPEHGAKTILLVALLTPLSVGFGADFPVASKIIQSYSLFAGIAVGALFFREAVRQYLLVTPPEKRWYEIAGTLEVVGMLALIGGLMIREKPFWGITVLVIPVVVGEVVYTTPRNSRPLLRAGFGVVVLGLLVPGGMILLGFTNPFSIAMVYGLFMGHHLLAILRAGTVLDAGPANSKVSLFLAGVFVTLTTVGYVTNSLGIGAPILLGLSAVRSAQIVLTESSLSMKRLGQTEALLSLGFVLGGALLLP